MVSEIFNSLNRKLEGLIDETDRNKVLNLKDFVNQMENLFADYGFRNAIDEEPIKNILIVKLDSFGDFILLSPAIREIRANYPTAHITLVVNKRVFPLAELCPYVNEVLKFDPPNVLDLPSLLKYTADFAAEHFWDKKFKFGFDFRYFTAFKIPNLFLLYFSGAKERAGYIFEPERLYTNNIVPPQQNYGNLMLTHPILNPPEIIHDCARNLYILQRLGLRIRRTDLEIWYGTSDLQRAKKLIGNFGEGRIKIALGIGASTPMRKYPVEKYLQALKDIVAKGASVIILGGPAEAEEAKILESGLPNEYLRNFVGISGGWRTDAAIMSQTDLYIGNDTGASNVAAAVHLPVIMLSREAKDKEPILTGLLSEYTMYYPWQTNAIVLRPEHALGDCANQLVMGGCNAGTSHCIAQINPSEIVNAYEKMIYFLNYAGIKKTSCPQFINSLQAIQALQSKITAPK